MWGCDAPKELLVMQRKWIVIAAAVIAAWPAGLDAQRTPRPPPPPRAPRAFAYSYSRENHGRVGVIVNTQPHSPTDKIGGKLEAGTPGRAGREAGGLGIGVRHAVGRSGAGELEPGSRRVLRHEGRDPRREGAERLEPAGAERRRDSLRRRAETELALTRDADLPLL